MSNSTHKAWARAADIAAQQWGNVTTRQLRRCGLDKFAVARAKREGRIFHVHPCVYALGRKPTSPHELAMAAVLSAGEGALLSDEWTLWLFDQHPLPSGLIHVSTPTQKSGREDIRLHRRRLLVPDCHFGIPTTRPARALADSAPRLKPERLRRIANQLQIDNLANPEELHRYPQLRDLVAADQRGATRSILEDLLLDLSKTWAWPPPAINAEIHGVECDFSWPGLVIQAHGWRFHRTKIAFENDHAVQLHLESMGERVIPVTYHQVTRLAAATRAQLEAVMMDRWQHPTSA